MNSGVHHPILVAALGTILEEQRELWPYAIKKSFQLVTCSDSSEQGLYIANRLLRDNRFPRVGHPTWDKVMLKLETITPATMLGFRDVNDVLDYLLDKSRRGATIEEEEGCTPTTSE